MTTTPSLTDLLCGLTPDLPAQADALAALPLVGSAQAQLEDLLRTTATFAVQGDGRCAPDPEGTTAHGAALLVLGYAASGLYGLLGTQTPQGSWETLCAARIWTLIKSAEVGGGIPEDLRVSFADTRFDGPEAIAAALPAVASFVGWAGAGSFAAWDVLSFLLHVGPTVDEGAAADLIDIVLAGLALATNASTNLQL